VTWLFCLRKGENIMKFVKKAVISFVLAIIFAMITGSGTKAGQNWIAFYITAWIMQELCIKNEKPLYKMVFIHAIWIAIAKSILAAALEIYMMNLTNQTIGPLTIVSGMVLMIGIYYVTATITGLLTVAWISGPNRKKEQEAKRDKDPT
jgi:hypothetical protein